MLLIGDLKKTSFDFTKYYQNFSKNFYEDWTEKSSVFSNPFNRTFGIRIMIEHLIFHNNLLEAIKLYNLAIKKDAWNPNVGIINNGMYGQFTLEEICKKRMNKAIQAINKKNIGKYKIYC